MFITADAFQAWAQSLLDSLEHSESPDHAAVVWPALQRLSEDRTLPKRICHWLEVERCNPPFDLDVEGNPLQVILGRSRHWRFLMYIWLPRSRGGELVRTAHDHSSTGYSLIHSGSCYVEREYRQNEDGAYCLHREFAPAPEEMREIRPALVHAVDPTESGGFSFIFWGPRSKTTTKVLDLDTGTISELESEHVDRLSRVMTGVRYQIHDLGGRAWPLSAVQSLG